jgi:hypothetical protein
MTTIVRNIIARKQAEDSQTTQYTAINCKTIIDKFTATNTTASPVTISVNLVPTAGSVSADNTVVYNKSIQAGETYSFPELVGQVLEPGGFISTIANAGAALTLSATGREIT